MNYTSEIDRTRQILSSAEKDRATQIINTFTAKTEHICLADVEGSLNYDISCLIDFIEQDSQSDELIKTLANIESFNPKQVLDTHLQTPLEFYRRNGKLYIARDGNHRVMLAIAKFACEVDEIYKLGRKPTKKEIDDIRKKYYINAQIYEGDASIKVANALQVAADQVVASLSDLSAEYINTHVHNSVAGARLIYKGGLYEIRFQGKYFFTTNEDEMINFINKTANETLGYCAFVKDGVGYITGDNTAFKTKINNNFLGLVKAFNEYREENINANYLVEVCDGTRNSGEYNVYTKVHNNDIVLSAKDMDALEQTIRENIDVLVYKMNGAVKQDPFMSRISDTEATLPIVNYEGLNDVELENLKQALDKVYKKAGFSNTIENDLCKK